MDTTTKVITGFLVGVAVGATAGLLLAPQSGNKTRKELGNESEKWIDSLTANVKDTVDDTIDAIRKAYNQQADELGKNAKKTAEDARRKLKTN